VEQLLPILIFKNLSFPAAFSHWSVCVSAWQNRYLIVTAIYNLYHKDKLGKTKLPKLMRNQGQAVGSHCVHGGVHSSGGPGRADPRGGQPGRARALLGLRSGTPLKMYLSGLAP